MKRPLLWVLAAGIFLGIAAAAYGYFNHRENRGRTAQVIAWIRSPQDHPDWRTSAGETCPGAPFQMPTEGFIGFLWDDSFRPGHRHSGLDIFGGGDPGDTPVYAAYTGYLTRLPEWKSSLILRIPSDPLQPGRQIWLYYTHLADPAGNSLIDPAFPPGTRETYVQAGALLGRQGNYSGTPNAPTGVHLHFSIVRDDGQGQFLNELDIHNTLDPSPYLGRPLNGPQNDGQIPHCASPLGSGV